MGSKRIGTFKKFLSQQRMKKINEAISIECEFWDQAIIEVLQEIEKECNGYMVWDTIIKYCKDKWSILGRTLPQPEYDENILTQHIKDLIFTVRGVKVMLDSDLAEIYGYQTGRFNQQVKNNIEKFGKYIYVYF